MDEIFRIRNEVVNTDQVSHLVAEMLRLKDAEYAVAVAADDCKAKEYELGQSFDHAKVAALEAARAKYEAARAARDAAMATLETIKTASAEGAALGVAGRELQGFTRFLEDMTAHQRAAAAVQTQAIQTHVRYASAVSGAATGTNRYQQNITALGYSLNDFLSVSGGLDQRLNAIANNLPGVFAGFGGLGLALGAVVPIIAMVYKNWDSLLNLIGEGAQNKIPANADAIKNLEDQLKGVNKQLDDYREKQKLTDAEVLDYNRLTAQQLELERQKTAEMESQNALKGLAGLAPKAQRERAAGFKEAVGEAGGGEQAAAQLRQAIFNVAEQTGQSTTLEAIAKQADELLIDASKGIKSARDTVRKTIEQGLPESGQGFARNIANLSPEGKQDRAIAEDLRKAAEQEARRQEKDRADERRRVEALNERGAENERAMRGDMERDAARNARNAPREADAARLAGIAERAQAAGANAETAQAVAPQIDKLEGLGLTFEQAFESIKTKREIEAAKMEQLSLRQAAMMERMMGVWGQASGQIQMLEQYVQMLEGKFGAVQAGVRKGGGNVGGGNRPVVPIR